MDRHLAFIELYEYKVADLLRGQEPAGGRRAVLELREVLLQTSLDGALSRRFSQVDRQFRAFRREIGAGEMRQAARAGLADTARPGVTGRFTQEDSSAWRELHDLVWFSRVQEQVRRFVLSAREEPGYPTLRVIYAVTETAERSLRGVAEAFSVPFSDDPLLSLGDREIAVQLGESLCELLLSSEGEKALQEALSRTRAQPFPPHVDEAVLMARIESVEREPLSQAAREELIQALRAQYPQAPDARERPAVRLACARLEELLDSFMHSRPASLSVPERSILYSLDPLAGMIDPPEEREELVIYLGTDSAGNGSQEAYWHDLHLRWQRGGQDWQFMIDKQLVLLRPSLPEASRHLKLRVGEETLRLYHTGNYVLLRHTLVPREALGALARQAHLTAQLLDPANTFANLRLGRALARAMRDNELDLEEFGPASAEKYSGVDAGNLLAFARQGAATLVSQTQQVTEAKVQDLLDSLTGLLNLPERHARVLRQAWQDVRLVTHTTVENSPALLHLNEGQFGAVKLSDQPLTLHFSGRAVTLNRDYKGDVAVLLPGGSAGEKAVLHDLLVIPVAELSLVLVKWHDWVAATIIRQLTVP